MKLRITYKQGSYMKAKIIETYNQWSSLYDINNYGISDWDIIKIEREPDVDDTTYTLDNALADNGLEGLK